MVPAEGGFGNVSLVQWIGAIVFLGGPTASCYRIPNKPASLTMTEIPNDFGVDNDPFTEEDGRGDNQDCLLPDVEPGDEQ